MTQLVLPHTIDDATDIEADEHQLNYTAIRDIINGQLEGGSGVNGNFKANGVTAREIADIVIQKGLPTLQGNVFQEGVLSATGGTDLKVTTSGSGLGLNTASGVAWVQDDSGIVASGALIPVTFSGSALTVAANASGNPRIDQIILTLSDFGTGTVSVLQGTATALADLTNRNGAAALPAGAIRLADILMSNAFAGPFVQNTHIRDRRGWASGAYYANAGALPTANQTPAAGTWTNLTGSTLIRLESTSGLFELAIRGHASRTTAGLGQMFYGLSFDGVAPSLLGGALVDNASGAGAPSGYQVLATGAGSHTFQPQCFSNVAVASFLLQTFGLIIREVPAASNINDGA